MKLWHTVLLSPTDRLAEYIGQATRTSRDGVIHDRLQGEHWLIGEMSHLKAGAFDLIDCFGIRNRHDQATKNAIPSSLVPGHWYKDFAMLTNIGALVQKPLDALSIDRVGDLSFPSTWARSLEFERNGRSYMPDTIMHSDHYNTAQKLAAMLLREVGSRVMQQSNSPVDCKLIGRWSPTSSLCQRDHVFGMKSPSSRRKRRSYRILR